MTSGWKKLRQYVRECRFAVRNSLDWRSSIHLLAGTARFHLHNAAGHRASSNSELLANIRIGPGQSARLALRPDAGDMFVLFEVLMDGCYVIPDAELPPGNVQVILDCGANVGITSLFFASRYPRARIFSVEPDSGNFELLKRNTACEPRILPIRGAIVGKPRHSVQLSTDQPAWGNFITDRDGGAEVPAFTIDQICDMHRLSRLDLLKVDIEGAEKDVFGHAGFLRQVGFVIIELHRDYDVAQFSRDIAPWSFVAEAPRDDPALKMIVARPIASGMKPAKAPGAG